MQKDPLALYFHWPFCLSKCPYCDFNSHIAKKIDQPRWAEQMIKEMHYMAELSQRSGNNICSIFFGGGTPSLMQPAVMKAIISAARDIFIFDNDIEITMEANPTSVEAEKLNDFQKAGVNRLSMGIQSLDPDALSFLGREHSAQEALNALSQAKKIFTRVSADFIYALPKQTLANWQGELEEILSLDLQHLSLYQLTMEPGTAFYSRHKQGFITIPDADLARQFYDLTQDITDSAACPAYEISNHARLGEESRHNMVYWQAGDWLGIGPGAYGRFWKNGIRTETQVRRNPDAWLNDVDKGGHGIEKINHDSLSDYAHEALMMGLRLRQGVDLSHIETRAPETNKWLNHNALATIIEAGFIEKNMNNLRLTQSGRPLLNSILENIIIKNT